MDARDAPRYLPGLRSLMIAQAALVGIVFLQVINLYFLNKKKRAHRVAVGKAADVVDTSMGRTFVQMDEAAINADGTVIDMDRTDNKNEDFVYLY
jgi:hypothetical protein